MHLNRRKFLTGTTTALAASAIPMANAQDFPSKPVTLIVPFAPGGNIDIVGRALATALGKLLGQSVIVDNRAGGGGAVGAGAVARAPADGYTLLVGTPGQIVTLPQMFKTTYTAAHFRPVGLASRTSVIVVARKADMRLKNFSDMAALARSKPGTLAAAHSGQGTPNHLAMLQLEDLLKTSFNIVPYRGSGPALVDLLGGQVDVHFDQVSSSMPHIKAGGLHALVVLGPQADPALPGVPTIGELGVGEIDATTYAGVFAPAGVPAEIMAKLSSAVQQATQDHVFMGNLRELGSMAYGGGPEQFGRIIESEAALARQMVKQGRLKGD